MNKKAIRKILSIPKSIRANKAISSIENGNYMIGDIPYQCQFASPEKAKDILEGKLAAKNDPNWAIFGFKTRGESEFWAWRDCGICDIKMILDFYEIHETIAKLVKRCLELGGYDLAKDYGWFYKPLLNLAKEYGIKGHTTSYLSTYELAKHVLKKQFVIASVNPSIIRLDKKIQSSEKRGHLVLVIGFKKHEGKITGFYINNPSGKTPEMQKNAFIPINVFIEAFGEQGIILEKKI